MEEKEFCSLLLKGAGKLEIDLSEQAAGQLFRYFQELRKWSRKINLIARNSTDLEIIEKHFLDSLTILPFLEDSSHLLDIGTGAGFPGLVCKAAKGELTVSLMEPRLKRVSFLRHIIRTLDLQDVTIIVGRAEDENNLSGGSRVSHIASRAVSEIVPFVRMMDRFCEKDSKIICMKGPRWQEELNAVESDYLSNYHLETHLIRLPFSGGERAILIFLKQ